MPTSSYRQDSIRLHTTGCASEVDGSAAPIRAAPWQDGATRALERGGGMLGAYRAAQASRAKSPAMAHMSGKRRAFAAAAKPIWGDVSDVAGQRAKVGVMVRLAQAGAYPQPKGHDIAVAEGS